MQKIWPARHYTYQGLHKEMQQIIWFDSPLSRIHCTILIVEVIIDWDWLKLDSKSHAAPHYPFLDHIKLSLKYIKIDYISESYIEWITKNQNHHVISIWLYSSNLHSYIIFTYIYIYSINEVESIRYKYINWNMDLVVMIYETFIC